MLNHAMQSLTAVAVGKPLLALVSLSTCMQCHDMYTWQLSPVCMPAASFGLPGLMVGVMSLTYATHNQQV